MDFLWNVGTRCRGAAVQSAWPGPAVQDVGLSGDAADVCRRRLLVRDQHHHHHACAVADRARDSCRRRAGVLHLAEANVSHLKSMFRTQVLLFAVAAALAAPLTTSVPTTRTGDTSETIHGVTIRDPYRWLEDQQSPETRAWIDAQNAYTRSVLDPLPGRAAISNRLEELLKTDRVGTPMMRNRRYFFMRRLADQNQFTICLRNSLDGSDQVLIDPNKSGGDQTTSVNIIDVSEDGKWLLYGTRQGGEDEVAVTILDVDANKEVDHLPSARYWGVRITPDKRELYYSKRQAEG